MSMTTTSLVSCDTCCKEIPLSAVLTPEGVEYVLHFCGLECFRRFSAHAENEIVQANPLPECDSAGHA